MFTKIIHTEIDINAGVRRVWSVLTDLEAYPEWNPMIRRAGGELRPGARLTVRFEPEGRRGHTFRPRLLTVEENRQLRWLGSPGIPLIFTSEHMFLLTRTDDNRCRLDHDMIFYGLAVPPVRTILRKATLRPFEEMNRALKSRAEQQSR